MHNPAIYPFGDTLKLFRVRARMSQQALANSLGVHRNTIGGWERGNYLPAQADMQGLIAALVLDDNDREVFLQSRYHCVPVGVSEVTSALPVVPFEPVSARSVIYTSVNQVFYNIPSARNPFFTGRASLLQYLHTRFSSQPTGGQVLALCGLGGLGKTQTALEYVYCYRESYSSILWIRSETSEELMADLTTFVCQLRLLTSEVNQETVLPAFQTWLLEHSGWLLIFDNVEDMQLIQRLLPPAHAGVVLLTTRTAITGAFAQAVELENMDETEGAFFLLKRATLVEITADVTSAASEELFIQAKKICRLLNGLPLALDQAGAYIHETQCSLEDYLEIYQEQQNLLLQRRGDMPPGHPLPVTSTFLLSFQSVEKHNGAAVALLCLCAFMAPEAIPEAIITQGTSGSHLLQGTTAGDRLLINEAIKILRRYSLVRRNPHGHTLTVHRLVQEVLKQNLDKDQQRLWARQAVMAVNTAFGQQQHWQKRQFYLPHAQVCARHIVNWDLDCVEAAQLLLRTGSHLQELGNYVQAEEHLAHAFALYRELSGPHHADSLYSLNKLADIFYYQGNYARALSLYQELFLLRQQVLEPVHKDIVQSLNDIGLLYSLLGDYIQARTFLTRAVDMREYLSPEEQGQSVECLHNLALLFTNQGNFSQAEQLLNRVISIYEQNPGTSPTNLASVLLNLAEISSQQSDFTRAHALLERALTLREQALGQQHPAVAECLHQLALLLYQQKDYDQAELFCREALTIRQQTLKSDHPTLAQSLNVLGLLSAARQEYTLAEDFFLQALALRERVLGQNHPKVALTLYDLATLYVEQKKYPLAESLFLRALSIYQQTPGASTSQQAHCQRDYASLRRELDGERKPEEITHSS